MAFRAADGDNCRLQLRSVGFHWSPSVSWVAFGEWNSRNAEAAEEYTQRTQRIDILNANILKNFSAYTAGCFFAVSALRLFTKPKAFYKD